MSFQLIGIEGGVAPGSVVVWGAAAVVIEGNVVNTVTRRKLSAADAHQLAADGHLHLITPPIEIDDRQSESPLIVARIDLGSPLHHSFAADRARLVGIAKVERTDSAQFYVFEDRASFDAYARRAADAVVADVLYSAEDHAQETLARHRNVVRTALTLVPSSPELNALRAYLAPTQAVERIARASLRGDISLRKFEQFLSALRKSGEGHYELKYVRGAATGGGLDVDVAANTFQALTKAGKLLRFPIHDEFPFLHQPPPFRLQKLEAASAHMYFVPNARADETLGDRVARYLSLRLLEDALDGRVELKDPDDQRALEETVQKIVRPSPDTEVRHKRLTDNELERVEAPVVEAPATVRSERMDLLGVISGLKNDNQAELQIASHIRISVSTDTTGEDSDEPPDGADTIRRDGRFLRRPCLMSIVRAQAKGGKPKYFLQALRLLRAGETVVVTALPSSVVDGAFMVGINLRVVYADDANRINGDLGEIAVDSSGTLRAATAFVDALMKSAYEYELAHPDPPSRWLQPSKPKEPSPLHRVIVTLAFLGGTAHVDAIRTMIDRRFGKAMWTGNVRREVLQNPELLHFDSENNRTVHLTDKGAAYHRVYVAAGGLTTKEHD